MEPLCPSSFVLNDSSWLIARGKSTPWTKEENKKFESALAFFDENTTNRWIKVASMIPGKSVKDVINQYRELEDDVKDIEAGLVPVPGYLTSSFASEVEDHRGFDVCRKRGRINALERKKGVPWTEDEHRLFLLGLEKHGKGDWRNISRNFVISKTPTQVASHAQKYYLRQASGGKDKRRPSIHDITVDNSSTAPSDGNNVPGLEKSSTLKSTQKPAFNNGALLVLDSTLGNPFVACPRNIVTYNRHFVNIVGSVPGLHLQSPRFHG